MTEDNTLAQCVLQNFGVSVSIQLSRFRSPGWFFANRTPCCCTQCGKPYEGFRKPYVSAGKTYHYWALVCITCHTAIQPKKLPPLERSKLYASSNNRPCAMGCTDAEFIDDGYSLYEKLMERDQNIRGFLMQIRPVPEAVDLWIFGDGESWGKLIERDDVIKANRDSIERVAHIFCDWLNACSQMEPQHELADLARRFELRLETAPKSIFKLLDTLQKQRNSQLIQRIQNFCDARSEST